jgi:hypothetical protein
MKLYPVALAILSVIIVANYKIQSGSQSKPFGDVTIDREILFPLIAYQPEVPLKPELIKLRTTVKGGSKTPLVRFRNQSGKSIRAYTIAYMYPGGSGGEWSSRDNNILSGELVPEKDSPAFDNASPLNDDQRRFLSLQGSMQSICIFMVVRIEFSDGSVFDDQKAYDSLKEYLEKMRL